MSRLEKFLVGLGATYGTQFLTLAVGILITPKLVSLLGSSVYGTWLILGQGLLWLGLIDLGVVAILSRDIASASHIGQTAKILRSTLWIIFLQLPLVILAVAGCVWWAVRKDSALFFPAVIVAVGFVISFPFRVFPAILRGKQDFAFYAGAQFLTWLLLTVSSLLLAMGGYGLSSLAWGWFLSQILSSAAYYLRWRACYGSEWPRAWVWPGLPRLVQRLRNSGWYSVQQVSQLLVNGVDLMILGALAGTESVAAFACTAKLSALGMHYPYSIALAASPALSEATQRGPEAQSRLGVSVSLLVTLLSGMIGLVILAANEIFVNLWMGSKFYTGFTTTALLVLVMMTRHYVFSLVQVLFSIGGSDGAIGLASILEGAFTVGAMILFCYWNGPAGIVLGSFVGLVLGSFPILYYSIHRNAAARRMLAHKEIGQWLIGFALAAAPILWVNASKWTAQGYSSLWVSIPALLGYSWFTWTLLNRDPLSQYVQRLKVRIPIRKDAKT